MKLNQGASHVVLSGSRGNSAVQVAPELLLAAMEQEMQRYLQSVMQAVNDAPDGAWIAGSEEQVRDLSRGLSPPGV